MLRNRGSRRIKIVCRLLLAAIFILTPSSAAEVPPLDSAGIKESGRLSSVLPKSRAALFEYRQNKVRAIARLGLYPEDYQPSEAVYGKVADGKGWTKSAGFHVSNPHLLLIATPPGKIAPITFWAPHDNSAGEQKILHNTQRMHIIYNDVSANHWLTWAYENKIRLFASNARDAGFQYAMLDAAQSKNMDIDNSGSIARAPTKFKDFFHYGDNVSANNISLVDVNMRLKLADNPSETKIYVKLWRQKPASLTTPEDYAHIIEVHPNPDVSGYDTIAEYEEYDVFDVVMDELLLWDNVISLALNILTPLALLALGFFMGRRKEKRHYASIRRREKAFLYIPTITAWNYDDTRPVKYVQLVYGSTAVSVDYFKRLLAFFRRLVGGEVRSYSSLVDRARREALLRMKESRPDSDIFVNVRLLTSSVTTGRQQTTACVEVIAYATAVRYQQ